MTPINCASINWPLLIEPLLIEPLLIDPLGIQLILSRDGGLDSTRNWGFGSTMQLFRNKRFMLDEMPWRNAYKFAILLELENPHFIKHKNLISEEWHYRVMGRVKRKFNKDFPPNHCHIWWSFKSEAAHRGTTELWKFNKFWKVWRKSLCKMYSVHCSNWFRAPENPIYGHLGILVSSFLTSLNVFRRFYGRFYGTKGLK